MEDELVEEESINDVHESNERHEACRVILARIGCEKELSGIQESAANRNQVLSLGIDNQS